MHWKALLDGLFFLFPCAVMILSMPLSSLAGEEGISVGYAVISGESAVPVVSALFGFEDAQGVLISEAGVAAVETIRRGRIFVDQENKLTGLALANPFSTKVEGSVILRDSMGMELARKPLALDPRQHLAKFVNEDLFFPEIEDGFQGSLTFEVGEPGLAAVTLRQTSDSHNNPILATLPVADLDQVVEATGTDPTGMQDSLVFPHIGAGDILATEIILIDVGGLGLTGQIELFSSQGTPLELEQNGEKASSFSFELSPNGVFRTRLTSSSGTSQGYARVSFPAGIVAPAGTAIFQFLSQGKVVSEAGVGAIPATPRARMFADTVGTQTGVAIANAGSDDDLEVTFELFDLKGKSLGVEIRRLPGRGHLAIFADELFSDLPPGFTGILELRSSIDFVPITLKLTFNQRAQPIVTTLPIADLMRPPTSLMRTVPQLGFGSLEGFGRFSTRLIYLGFPEQPFTGNLEFRATGSGADLEVPLAGTTASSFDLIIPAGGALQQRPGNRATPSRIMLDSTQVMGNELPVNVGSAVSLGSLVIDSEGDLRDDFPVTLTSLDSEVASIAEDGRIQGLKPGFSTLVASTLSGVSATAVITVSDILPGPTGFQVGGITQDLNHRLYLAASSRHAVLTTPDLEILPEVYAGVDGMAGFRNATRLESLFNRPSFLSLNQATGSLFMSDRDNHVIRRIPLSNQGQVQTLAGDGSAGSRDGVGGASRFNQPEGIALDGRGFLWIADRGNHAIRRLELTSGQVTTVAGSPGSPGLIDGVGASARFNQPTGIVVLTETLTQRLERELAGLPPPAGAVVVVDTGNRALRRVSEEGLVETLAVLDDSGNSQGLFTPAGGMQLSAEGVAVDAAGNLFVSDSVGQRVVSLLVNGELVEAGQAGTFGSPSGITIDTRLGIVVAEGDRIGGAIVYGPPVIEGISPRTVSSLGGTRVTLQGSNFAPDTQLVVGNIVIRDFEIIDTSALEFTAPPLQSGRTTLTLLHRGGLVQAPFSILAVPIEEIDLGEITTVAGGTTFVGDGGLSQAARVAFPQGVALDNLGNLYIADTENHRIRRVDMATGLINTIAGSGEQGFAGDGSLAQAAALNRPFAVALDPAGNIFISDFDNDRIRRVDALTGLIDTFAGSGVDGFFGDGGQARDAQLGGPRQLAFAANGDLYFADSGNDRVRRVLADNGLIQTVAGNDSSGFSGDGVSATETSLSFPTGVALDAGGNLYIADRFNGRVRRVDAGTGLISTVAGGAEDGTVGDGGPATAADLGNPARLSIDGAGNLFFSDPGQDRVRRVDSAGTISTVAGTGTFGFSGDGGPAAEAQVDFPEGVAVDGPGNLYLADRFNNRVRRVDSQAGIIETIVGSQEVGFSGDGGPASVATLVTPIGVAFDSAGNLYIAELENPRVRRVSVNGEISTIAGNGEREFSGDGGPAAEAGLDSPFGLAVGPDDGLFISTQGGRIRYVDPLTGVISTVAGNGCDPFFDFCDLGDGGPAVDASLDTPEDLKVDANGNLYIADTLNQRVRFVNAMTGIINTLAGSGFGNFSGDGGPAVNAGLGETRSIALHPTTGFLYIVDRDNQRVRRVDNAGIIDTVAGNGCVPAFSECDFSDGRAATETAMFPRAIAFDRDGALLIADVDASISTGERIRQPHRIRRMDPVTGQVSTIAGGGSRAQGLGDLKMATEAFLNTPEALVVDPRGNLFVSDTDNQRIRAIRRSP